MYGFINGILNWRNRISCLFVEDKVKEKIINNAFFFFEQDKKLDKTGYLYGRNGGNSHLPIGAYSFS